jgi:hypothetical protein
MKRPKPHRRANRRSHRIRPERGGGVSLLIGVRARS